MKGGLKMSLVKPTKLQELERQVKDTKKVIQTKNYVIMVKTEENIELQKELLEKEKMTNMLHETIGATETKYYEAEARYRQSELEKKELLKKNANLQKALDSLKNSSIAKNSSNSSKPSSTDEYYTTKVYNNRPKTDRKAGGQQGHKGRTLQQLEATPSAIEIREEHQCLACGGEIIADGTYSVKQRIELKIERVVHEQRVQGGSCTTCGCKSHARHTEDYINPIQYGTSCKAFVNILRHVGYVSYPRISQMMSELTGLKMSKASIINYTKEFGVKAFNSMDKLLTSLIQSSVVHVDETTIKVKGKATRVAATVTNEITHLRVKGKHLAEELPEIFLELYQGIVVHDHDKKYYKNTMATHAECNAHILRYVTYYIELYKHKGATAFIDLLKKVNRERYAAIATGASCFPFDYQAEIRVRYREHLATWQSEHDKMVEQLSAEHIKKYHRNEQLLIHRLVKYEDAHLLFMQDFDVPFTNNEAERAFRILKILMNVSGTFRSEAHAHYVMSIQSLLGTARKQGLNILDVIERILKGEQDFLLK